MSRQTPTRNIIISITAAISIAAIATFLTLLLAANSAKAATAENSPRALVHLLDYLAQDYPGAVADGKILSATEYKEQLDFSETAVDINNKLSETKSNPEVQKNLTRLHALIVSKAGADDVASLALKIKTDVIKITGLEVSPAQWPSLQSGQKLFSQNCVTCHGVKGDGNGPAAAALDPKPANFLDPKKMEDLSPFQVFNTIRIGVPGTPMAPFPKISDKDAWSLAFYVMSLIHRKEKPAEDKFKDLFTKAVSETPLEAVSTMNDEKLEAKLNGSPDMKKSMLAALRTHNGDDDVGSSLAVAKTYLDEAVAEYKKGDYAVAKQKALTAYLEGIEPVEPRLKASDSAVVSDLESRMATVRSTIEAKLPMASLETSVADAKAGIQEAETLLGKSAPSPWLTFMIASAILLREGFEAVLIVLALLGVVRAAGDKKAAAWVHSGWLVALGLGFAAWFFSGWLIGITGAQRELMEGVTSLIAVVVLLYMGFWLHRTTEIGRWTNFINVKVKTALQGKNLFGLAAISFVAVFREAFETVLFLRALWLEGGDASKTALVTGVLGSLVLILILSWLLLKFAMKIPIRRLFDYSSTLMAVLAVILIGKALHSLQETGILTITASPVNLRAELVGLYPTLETIISQIAIIAVCTGLWIYGKKPSGVTTTKTVTHS